MIILPRNQGARYRLKTAPRGWILTARNSCRTTRRTIGSTVPATAETLEALKKLRVIQGGPERIPLADLDQFWMDLVWTA